MLYGIEESIHEQSLFRKAIHKKPQELGRFCLDVYNTCTQEMETVEVSKDVYMAYQRGVWRVKKRDRSFFAHEIQFSSMCPNEDNDVDSFHEFVNYDADPEVQFMKCETISILQEAVCSLPSEEQAYIKALFEENKTEAALADALGVSQQAVNRKKQRILEKLKKILKERL